MSSKIYYLNCQTWGTGEILLNGFPVDKLTGEDARASASMLNPYLCGKGNTMEFRIKGRVKGTVEWHAAGDVVVTGAKPPSVVKVKLNGKEADEFETVDGTLAFDSPDVDCSALFRGDPLKVPDEELLDFGEKLAKAFDTCDLKAIGEMFRQKLEDYNHVFPQATSLGSFVGMMREMCKKFKIERKNMCVVRLCNDRVYEIKRRNGEPFISAKIGGGIIRMPIYVSKVDGRLGVVR